MIEDNLSDMQVLEVRPVIDWDKGKAVEFLLESLGINTSLALWFLFLFLRFCFEDWTRATFLRLKLLG